MTVDPRKLLVEIEKEANHQNWMMLRLIDTLREMIADREAIEALQRHELDTRLARSSFIVEAAALLVEHNTGVNLRDIMNGRAVSAEARQ